MDIDLYLAETRANAERNSLILEEARQRLANANGLTQLEFAGALHALQVLTENAIGKAKHFLKHNGMAVPVSAYDAFAMLAQSGRITQEELGRWQRAVGLRNRIVHDYLNLDKALVCTLIEQRGYDFVVEYLKQPL